MRNIQRRPGGSLGYPSTLVNSTGYIIGFSDAKNGWSSTTQNASEKSQDEGYSLHLIHWELGIFPSQASLAEWGARYPP
jgi:hypothetical protein